MDTKKTENRSSCVKSVVEILVGREKRINAQRKSKSKPWKCVVKVCQYRQYQEYLELFEKQYPAGFEMWTYVGGRRGAKRNFYWVWTAVIEVEDGEEVVTFEVGKRDEETFLKVMEKYTFCWKILHRWVWGLEKKFSWK